MARPATRTEIGRKPNEGARLLLLAMRRRGETLRDVTDALGLGAGSAYRWAHCDRLPGAQARVGLSRLYGVPVEAWDEAPRRAIVLEARRAA